jgi:hypothetical protein
MKTKDIEKVIEKLKAAGAQVTVEKKDCEFFPQTTYSYEKEVMTDWGCYLGLTWGFITVCHAGGLHKRSSVSVRHHNWYDEGHSMKPQMQWAGFDVSVI